MNWEQDTGSGTSTATVYYELSTDGTTFGSWATATYTGGVATTPVDCGR